MKAYVLINVRAGTTRDVLDKVQQVQGVRRADICWGRPDIITLVDLPDGDVLGEVVLADIQLIEGVQSTDTHLVFE
jgi:DNA-binding Lrp family transcriptional regulator